MAWTTGTVKKFCNTVITTDQVLGTGNGVLTSFSGTITNAPVFLDSVKIKYTISAVQYILTANSAGVFSGTGLSSGTVNEAGEVSLSFSTAPDNGTSVSVDEYQAKGFIQKLLDFVAGPSYTETIGTGDGSDTTFSATLTNGDIAKGQCRVKFKIAGVTYDVWDNGEGAFLHAQITSGTINYSTKAVAFTFAAAIDNGFAVACFYVAGAAAEGRDWITHLKRNTKTSAGSSDAFSGLELKEVVLKNSGVSYKEDIIVGIREWRYVTSNYYGLNLNVYQAWANAQEASVNWNGNNPQHGLTSYDATTNNFSTHPNVPMSDAAMTYWIFANKRRIIGVIKHSGSVYTCFYIGAGVRYSSPSKYPKPYIALGCHKGNAAFTSTASDYAFIADVPIASAGSSGNGFGLRPDGNYDRTDDIRFNPKSSFTNSGEVKRTKGGDVPLFPVVAWLNSTPPYALYDLDGVFLALGNNLSAETIITSGGKDYIVFPNIFRTTYQDYMAIPKE